MKERLSAESKQRHTHDDVRGRVDADASVCYCQLCGALCNTGNLCKLTYEETGVENLPIIGEVSRSVDALLLICGHCHHSFQSWKDQRVRTRGGNALTTTLPTPAELTEHMVPYNCSRHDGHTAHVWYNADKSRAFMCNGDPDSDPF